VAGLGWNKLLLASWVPEKRVFPVLRACPLKNELPVLLNIFELLLGAMFGAELIVNADVAGVGLNKLGAEVGTVNKEEGCGFGIENKFETGLFSGGLLNRLVLFSNPPELKGLEFKFGIEVPINEGAGLVKVF